MHSGSEGVRQWKTSEEKIEKLLKWKKERMEG
jgi:hypothetical protein